MNNTTHLITDTGALVYKLNSFGRDHKAAFDFLNEQNELAQEEGGFYMDINTGIVDTWANWQIDNDYLEGLVKAEFSFYEQSWYELDI